MLSREQVAAYEDNGYVEGLDCFESEAEIADSREKLHRALSLIPPPNHVKNLGNWHAVNDWVYSIAAHPKVLDAVESVIGPDFFCWGAMIFYKEPHKDQVIRWHQGTGIWPLRSALGLSLSGNHKKDGVPVASLPTVLFGISDLSIENGCLRVLPGTHKGPTLLHKDETDSNRDKYLFEKSIPDSDVDESVGVKYLQVKAGQFSVHHGVLIHSSGPNNTDSERCGIALRYATYDVVFDDTEWPQVWCIPMRGKNKFGTKHNIVPPPTSFEVPKPGDLPHMSDHLSAMQKASLKARRAMRKVLK